MLLNDAQIALNDVIVNCKDAADLYDDAAGMVEDGRTAALFRELAGRRRAIAAELETHIRKLGGLPRDAGGDRETVQRLLARLRANLSEDKRIALLTEREAIECQLDEMVSAALQQAIPDETKAYLDEVKADIADARQRLTEAKSTISSTS